MTKESTARRRMTASDLWAIRRITGLGAGRGKIYALVTTTGADDKSRGQIVCVDPSTAQVSPLTAGEESVASFAVDAAESAIAFCRAPGPGVPPQLWVLPLTGGEAKKVTDLPLGADDPHWVPGRNAVVIRSEVYSDALAVDAARTRAQETAGKVSPRATEDRVFRYWDRWLTGKEVAHLFLVDLDSHEVRDVIPSSVAWFELMDPSGAFAVSPDGLRIAYAADIVAGDHSVVRLGLWVVDIAGGEPRRLPTRDDVDCSMPVWTPDGSAIIYGEQPEPASSATSVRLVRLEVESGRRTALVEDIGINPRHWRVCPDGRRLWFSAEDQGGVSLWEVPLAGGSAQRVARGGSVGLFAVSPQGDVVVTHSSLASFPEIAVPERGSFRRLTSLNSSLAAELQLGRTESMSFAGAGGAPVHMHVVYPPGHSGRSGRVPLLHLVHGGPHGAWHDELHMRWNAQVFAAQGYAVALVNFHGSSSFGDAFSSSICGAWGDKPPADIEAATDHLIGVGLAEPSALFVAGGSYGGYLTAWLTSQSHRYRAALAHAAVFDFRILFASDMTDGISSFVMGAAPWEDRERALRYDPASWVGECRTPVLVTHGEKDYRVTLAQALAMYGTLKAKGVPARLVVYPDENHWIAKPANSRHWYREVLAWFERHGGPPSPGGAASSS